MARDFNRLLLKYSVDEEFFGKWTSRMAYILGFTFADGNIYKNSISWDIQSRDIKLLAKINRVVSSNYPVNYQRSSVRLRINNKIFVNNAIRTGLIPKKSLRLKFPKMSKKYLRHFVRGYLDGDGWISIRKNRDEIDLGFVCGNKSFLTELSEKIEEATNIKGKIRVKNKTTPKGTKSTTYLLEYYSSNAFTVANWACSNLQDNDLFLDRKLQKYLEAKKLDDFLKSGSKKVRTVQELFGKSIKEILTELYLQDKLNGVVIAKKLNVHSSSIYRWLKQTGIKYAEHRD